MKKKIVLWGSDEKDEKQLVALELIEADNNVNVYTFKQEVATEEFYNAMLNEWREGKELEFPAHEKVERPLTISDQILPDNIKVDRTDIISRAQAEWHFVVLSSKLYQMYKSEVDDLSDTIESMTSYDNGVWNDLKNFWSKVSEQVYEKNLFREHASNLKKKTNNLFDQLKEMKKSMDKELDEVSGKHKEIIMSQLSEIEGKIEKGLGLKPIFEELKQLQSRIRNMDFNNKHRRQVWDKIDAAFKVVKEKRFGSNATGGGNSPVDRLERRLNGLNNAIGKMERSIRRDKEDQEWQAKRANTTDGQLEMQIRQAKIKMIDERVKSKVEKLDDMLKTRKEIESKIVSERAREEKRKAAEENKKAKAAAAEAAKAKIAEDIKAKSTEMAADAKKLEEAASQIAASKKKKSSKSTPLPGVPPVELPQDDATDSTDDGDKGQAATQEGKAAEEGKAQVEKEVRETIEKIEDKIEDVKDSATDIFSSIAATVGEALEDVIDTVKAVAEVVEDKIEDVIDNTKTEEE